MQASRANTLDGILDELPDFSDGYFSYPVDELFPNYVEALGQKGFQDAPFDRSSNGEGDFSFFNANNLGVTSLPLEPAIEGNDENMSIPVSKQDYSNDVMQGSGRFTLQSAQPNSYVPQFQDTIMEMPVIGGLPDTAEEKFHSEESGSFGPGRRTRGVQKSSSDFHADSGDAMDSDDAAPARKGSRPAGKAKRNPKQQAQNKQAQQRYRERRKARFNEMESAIDDLTARLEQMQAVQSQNAMLVAKSHELESVLAVKEQELDKLRSMAGDNPEGNSQDESYEQRKQAADALVHDFQGQVAMNVTKMKDFIEQHGLKNLKPTGENMNPEVRQQLSDMIEVQCGAKWSHKRADGVQLLRMMSADVSQLSRIRCMRKNESVQRGLQEIKLTDQQKSQILMLRSKHIKDLEEVYETRQELNFRAAAFILPGDNTEGLSNKMKLERMRIASYRRMAAQTVHFDEILSNIKENLRLEQKRVMELNYLTLKRILSPLQAALYLTETYPMSFDALELANTLAVEAGGANNPLGNNNTSTVTAESSQS